MLVTIAATVAAAHMRAYCPTKCMSPVAFCCFKRQPCWLKTAEMYSPTVLETRSLKPR